MCVWNKSQMWTDQSTHYNLDPEINIIQIIYFDYNY